MSQRLKSTYHAQLAWILPILALSPLALGAKGCNNAGVIGDDCPTGKECATGTAGKGSAGSGGGGSKSCGGLIGAGCGEGQFCDYPSGAHCGAADQAGTCVDKPRECTLVYSPVCGCDGQTYSNECAAQSAGQSVAYTGECAPPGSGGSGSGGSGSGGSGSGGDGFCGGIANIECSKGEYCDYPLTAQCGAGDQSGTCKRPPRECDPNYSPVCGCDGETYGNACSAAAQGVSVAALGECGAPGKPCGELGGCDEGEYCQFPPDAHCGTADAPGVCAKIPINQACPAIYAPVCGCDGKTYSSDCVARLAGVSIAAEGECDASDGEVCGGLLGRGCKEGYFCDYPDDQPACGAADATGTCVEALPACDAVFDEVCGCDGKTYSSECVANAAGTDISSRGACK